MLVLPFMMSKDPLLFRSMELSIYVGKYFLHKVCKRFYVRNAGNIMYFVYIFWLNVDTVRQFCYFEVSISKFETTHVNVLQGLVLASSHVFTVFEDSEESPNGTFLH